MNADPRARPCRPRPRLGGPRRWRWRPWAGAVGSVLLALTAVFAGGPLPPAAADATAPPGLANGGAGCPLPSYPPAGYPVNAPPIPYEVPFTGTIDDGMVTLPAATPAQPSVVIPHVYGSVCGLVNLPTLHGTIASANIYLAATNAYIGGIEALPVQLSFPQGLSTDIAPRPAPNGGLNISLTTEANQTVNTLGMSCTLSLPSVTFTTQTSGALTGAPVTGPTKAGVAEVVSNDFAVPAVQTSTSCPPSIAATFNKLLGLPVPAGRAKFVAPFTFHFELTCQKLTSPQGNPIPCNQQPGV